MEHPKVIGDRTTLAVMLGLAEAGYRMLLPFGENTRYDLVIEERDRLARVQCKTGRLQEGAVRFKVCNIYAHHPNPKVMFRDYHGEVGYFGIYCPDNGDVYLIPIEDLPVRRQGNLRVDPPRNGQQRGIRFAASYRIATISCEPTKGPAVLPGAAGSSA